MRFSAPYRCVIGSRAFLAKAPVPECKAARRERADFNSMLDGLTAEKPVASTWTGDSLLDKTLRNSAAAVDQRERQKRESSWNDETAGS